MRFPSEMSDKRLVRLLPNGDRDETYYNSGLGGATLKQWQNERFYVGGPYNPRRIWHATGQNDNSFKVGISAIPYYSPLQGGDYHVFEDGRVLVTGHHILSDSIRGFVGSYRLIWFSRSLSFLPSDC